MAINLNEIKRAQQVKSKEKNKPEGLSELLNRDFKIFGDKVSDNKKEQFYSELNILISSGIDIKSSFDIFINEQKKEADKKLFSSISEKILQGSTMSEAIASTRKFSSYEYYSLKIGEESGKLSDVLTELASYYNKRIKQKRQLLNALTYPAIILITAVSAVVFMLKFLVPMFKDVFKQFKGELPYLTKIVIKLSENFSGFFVVFVFFSLGLIAVIYLLSKNPKWKYRLSAIKLKLPLIGPFFYLVYLSRFCQSMALLTASKNPLLNSIQLVKKMIGSFAFEYTLTSIETEILYGRQLNESMGTYPLFDKRLVALIKVAEEVNQLDRIFKKLYEQYYDRLEHRIAILSSMLEPLLIIFVGIFVGIILIAMYLPMFALSNSFF